MDVALHQSHSQQTTANHVYALHVSRPYLHFIEASINACIKAYGTVDLSMVDMQLFDSLAFWSIAT